MARHRLPHRAASLVVVAALLLLSPLTAAAAAARGDATAQSHGCSWKSRRLLVTAPRVSPETRSVAGPQQQQQQEMDVAGWRAALPFRRAGASLGRRVPGSQANPSHN